MSLGEALIRVPPDAPILLKMDIEGWEYPVLDDVMGHVDRFCGLVFELHDLDKRAQHAMLLLLRLMGHFDVVHLHANNNGGVAKNGWPAILEVAMVRRDEVAGSVFENAATYPVSVLDVANIAGKPDISLRFGETTAGALGRVATS